MKTVKEFANLIVDNRDWQTLCDMITARDAEIAAGAARKEREAREGHGKPCWYCHEPCNGLAANPGLWPIGLCHADEPGVTKWHHADCIYERLEP